MVRSFRPAWLGAAPSLSNALPEAVLGELRAEWSEDLLEGLSTSAALSHREMPIIAIYNMICGIEESLQTACRQQVAFSGLLLRNANEVATVWIYRT